MDPRRPGRAGESARGARPRLRVNVCFLINVGITIIIIIIIIVTIIIIIIDNNIIITDNHNDKLISMIMIIR